MRNKDITLTPLELIDKIGIFDLDPCGFNNHATAKNVFIYPNKDGLKEKWYGKVWLNPPFSSTEKWIKKLSEHNNGIACVLNSTETLWFQEYVFKKATGILFLKSRPKFLNKDFKRVNIQRGVILASYGQAVNMLKDCNLEGTFIDLRTRKEESSHNNE